MATAEPGFALKAARVVTPQGVLPDTTVVVQDQRIAWMGTGSPPAAPRVHDLGDATLLPGFIDVHVHGGGGWRVGDQPEDGRDAVAELSRFLATTGVTGFLPTLSTAEPQVTLQVARQVGQLTGIDLQGADVLGTHLEGPYLNPRKKGAQREDLIRPPSAAEFHSIWRASGGTIRYMTIAPEMEGAPEFIRLLTELGVFASAGHSDATAAQMKIGFEAGIQGATHLFNGMRGLHHREPGVVGAALAQDGVWVELIADGVHVHPTALRVAIRAKGIERVVVITDAGAYAGMPDGVHNEGYRVVTVKGGWCTLPDGTIAESTSPMNRNCMILKEQVGLGWVEIARVTALNPATLLGLQQRRGSIEVGKDADLTVLGPSGETLLTTVRGRVVHDAARLVRHE